jgi:acetoin utilization deacetylase AcuC-like enzyme
MIPACYSPAYYADTPTTSMRKLPLVAQAVRDKWAYLVEPPAMDTDLLSHLHDPEYVRDFMEGAQPRASSQGWPWSEQIRDGVLAINSGQIKGAELALQTGLAANIAQGFHHAIYAHGMGFCTFNGLALVAQEFPGLRVGVLDCDNHYGNGTAEFTHRLTNLHNFTIYGQPGRGLIRAEDRNVEYPIGSCTEDFPRYEKALRLGFDQMVAWKIDLMIYQAGADAHVDDPHGSIGLTTEQLRLRDRQVFAFARAHAIPTLFVLAGGYQEPLETKLVPLHVATFEEAFQSRV